jgi:WD40 repeat protein
VELLRPSIPDYELIRLVGQGSYGDVWLAKGITGSFRAIKVVWRRRFADARPYEREFEGISRFAAISIREPSQLALLHVGRNAEFFYYVMELADDVATGRDIDPDHYTPRTLAWAPKDRSYLPVDEVIELGVALTKAVATLHANHLVHRDIKPSNVIFVGGVPKLADVGLVAEASAGLTFVGTEGFVPPEGPGAFSADVYSLGKVLYGLATGLEHSQYPRLPPDLSERPDCARLLELNEILFRACENNAQKRYPDAAALLEELLLLQAGKSVRRLRLAERRTTAALRAAAVLALVAMIASIGVLIERARANHESALRIQAEAARDELARKNIYSAGLVRAQRALETEDLGRARRILQELKPSDAHPDLRGFEWRVLWNQAQGDDAEILDPHGPPVDRVAFSPNRALIATHTIDGSLTLRQTSNHQVLRRLPGISRFAGFSADSDWLEGTDAQRRLIRWKVGATSPVVELPGYQALAPVGPARGLVYRLPLSATATTDLALWDFASHRMIWRTPLGGDARGLRWGFFNQPGAATAGDGRWAALILIAGIKVTARWKLEVVDLATGAVVFGRSFAQRPSTVNLSPDGKNVLYGLAESEQITLLNWQNGQILWSKRYGPGETDASAFSLDGRTVIIAGQSGAIRSLAGWDGSQLGVSHGHDGDVLCVAAGSTEQGLLLGTSAGEIRITSGKSRTALRDLAGDIEKPAVGRGIRVSGSGRFIASTLNGQMLEIADASSARVVGRIAGTWYPVAFDETDTELILVDGGGSIYRWNWRIMAQPVLHGTVAGTPISVAYVRSSRNGHVIAVGDNAGMMHFLHQPDGPAVSCQAHHGDVWWSVLSPDGKLALSCGKDMTVAVWDTASGRLLTRWSELVESDAAAFSSDGRLAAIGFDNGDIKLYSMPGGKVVTTFVSGAPSIRSMLFTPDGERLVVGGENGELHIFSCADWRPVAMLAVQPDLKLPGATTIFELDADRKFTTLAGQLNFGRLQLWTTGTALP